jgi:hypothetical protein
MISTFHAGYRQVGALLFARRRTGAHISQARLFRQAFLQISI